MLSRAEIKRRKQQSARDKARHRVEQEELERRQQQSLRDRIRHRWEQNELHRTARISQTFLTPASIEEASAVVAITMASPSKVRRTGIFSTTAYRADSTIIPGISNLASVKEPRSESSPPFSLTYVKSGSRMFNNSEYADVKITFGNVDVSAHRFVLCLQSEYFANALTGVFKKGLTRTLECPPQKEHAYTRILQYLYTGNYEEETSRIIEEEGMVDMAEHYIDTAKQLEQMIMSSSKILGSIFWQILSSSKV